MVLHWTNLTSFHPGCFVPSLVEIRPVVLEKNISKFRHCIFAISLLSPLRKGQGPSIVQPFTQDAKCRIWLKLDQWFWRRWKPNKFFTTTTMDNGQILIKKAHMNLQLNGTTCNRKTFCQKIKVKFYFSNCSIIYPFTCIVMHKYNLVQCNEPHNWKNINYQSNRTAAHTKSKL